MEPYTHSFIILIFIQLSLYIKLSNICWDFRHDFSWQMARNHWDDQISFIFGQLNCKCGIVFMLQIFCIFSKFYSWFFFFLSTKWLTEMEVLLILLSRSKYQILKEELQYIFIIFDRLYLNYMLYVDECMKLCSHSVNV